MACTQCAEEQRVPAWGRGRRECGVCGGCVCNVGWAHPALQQRHGLRCGCISSIGIGGALGGGGGWRDPQQMHAGRPAGRQGRTCAEVRGAGGGQSAGGRHRSCSEGTETCSTRHQTRTPPAYRTDQGWSEEALGAHPGLRGRGHGSGHTPTPEPHGHTAPRGHRCPCGRHTCVSPSAPPPRHAPVPVRSSPWQRRPHPPSASASCCAVTTATRSLAHGTLPTPVRPPPPKERRIPLTPGGKVAK